MWEPDLPVWGGAAMIEPRMIVQFRSIREIEKQAYDLHIKNIDDAIRVASDNQGQLREWELYLSDKLGLVKHLQARARVV